MGLKGKLVSQISIKTDGDVFHGIFREKPHLVSGMSPGKIKSCGLHQGQLGTVGSVVVWKYFDGGKESFSKEIIEAIDDEKKLVTYKVIEGDLTEHYKSFKTSVQVEKGGEDNVVTWTLEYEKMNENVPNPNAIMDVLLNVTKDIDTHLNKAPQVN